MRVPGLMRTVLTMIAGASLQIYLVHNVVTHEFLYIFHIKSLPLIIGTSVAAGVILKWLQDRIGQRLLAADLSRTGQRPRPRAPEA
jgi:uncharacterized integral membrane protein